VKQNRAHRGSAGGGGYSSDNSNPIQLQLQFKLLNNSENRRTNHINNFFESQGLTTYVSVGALATPFGFIWSFFPKSVLRWFTLRKGIAPAVSVLVRLLNPRTSVFVNWSPAGHMTGIQRRDASEMWTWPKRKTNSVPLIRKNLAGPFWR